MLFDLITVNVLKILNNSCLTKRHRQTGHVEISLFRVFSQARRKQLQIGGGGTKGGGQIGGTDVKLFKGTDMETIVGHNCGNFKGHGSENYGGDS